jgi:TolB-like protein
MSGLLRRLKQRKIVQWTLAYCSGAWVLLQVLAMLSETYGWPAAIMRALPVLLAGGLLVTLVLAWFHGEAGRQRVSGVELVLITAILVLAGGLLAWVGGRADDVPDALRNIAPGERSIAVLPFVNVSGDPAQEYFSDGITDEILTALGQLGDLHVTARTSAFHFKGQNLPVRDVAARLGVAYILEGSILKSGAQVRITTRLVNAQADRQLWSESYQRPLDDVLALHREIARSVASALELQLASTAPERPLPTRNAAAHDLFLQGQFHWNRRTARDVERAIALFEEAAQLDPGYAQAHAGIALAYAVLPLYTAAMSAVDALPLVERAAARALAIDSTLAAPYAALGYSYHWQWRWADAGREFERAIALDPDNTVVLQWYGEYLAKVGRGEEGIAAVRRAVDVDPYSPTAHGNLGVVLSVAGRDDEAIRQLEHTRAMDPSLSFPLTLLHKIYLTRGRIADAYRAGRQWAELGGRVPPDDIQTILDGIIDASRREPAMAVLARWEREPHPLWLDIIFYYLQLNETDRALAALQRAVDQRALLVSTALTAVWFEPLRRHPRFEEVVSVMR